MWNHEKIWHQNLINLTTTPDSCSHLTLGNPKKSFSTILVIRTFDYLRYLRIKGTEIDTGYIFFHRKEIVHRGFPMNSMIGYTHRGQPRSATSVLTVSYARVPLSASPLIMVSVSKLRCITWGAATSDPQHWQNRVCLSARQCTSTSRSRNCRASAPWNSRVYQFWHVASQQPWSKAGRLPHLEHDAGACVLSPNPRYERVAAAACWDMEFQKNVVDNASEKDWKRVSMQKVVTLNTCCDVVWLTYKFSLRFFSEPSMPYNTTSSFPSHQHLEKTMYLQPEYQMHMFCISQGSAVTFFRRGGQIHSHGFSLFYSEITQIIRSTY